MTVKSDCGAVDLLAAIFGKDRNEIRLRKGLPPGISLLGPKGKKRPWYRCLNCEKLTKKKFCSFECHHNYYQIPVECSICGKIFKVRQGEFMARFRNRRVEEIFCSKQCQGRWLGKNYGHKRPRG